MFAPRWIDIAPRRQRRKNDGVNAPRIDHAARAPTRTGTIDAVRNGARSAWNQSLPTGTLVGGVRGFVIPMKPTCSPSRDTGRTVRTARNVEPFFRMSVTSSSNFPLTTASRRSRGTSVGTFFGRWNIATLIFPITSSRDQPKSSAASAAYCWTIPFMSHVITDVSAVNGLSPSVIADPSRLRFRRRGEGTGLPHVADLRSVLEHRADGKDRGEPTAVLPDEGDLLLELPVLHGLPQQTWHEGRHVLGDVERGDAHLSDHLVAPSPEKLRGVRPQVLAIIIRVHRRGPFKDLEAIRREARALVRRYRLVRFEVMFADRERGEYVAWIEWKVPEPLQEGLATGGGIVPLQVVREDAGSARLSLLVSDAVLPKFRELLDRFDGRAWLPAGRRAPAGAGQPLGTLTHPPRERP